MSKEKIKNKLRIAILADPLDRQYGGIHVYVKELLDAISKIDHKQEFLLVRSDKKEAFEGIEEIIVPWRNFPGYRAWRLLIEIPRILVKKQVDLVIEPAHFGPFNLPKSIRRVTVIHDMTMFLFPKDHLFLSQFLQRKCLPFILRKTDHIITNSRNTSKDLEQFFPFTKNKNTPILLGKNNSYHPSIRPEVLNQYKIQKPYFLHTGTLEPRKNIPLLIRAFEQFKSQTGLGHQLILIGKQGWKAQKILEAINTSVFKKDIKVLGYVEAVDLPVFYSMTEAFVYPSKYEGFGLPILEAMACGAPVLTSKVSSLPEVGGTAAMYFEAGSADDLAKQLEKISTDKELKEKLSQTSIEQADRFSWEKTAWKTIEVLNYIGKQDVAT